MAVPVFGPFLVEDRQNSNIVRSYVEVACPRVQRLNTSRHEQYGYDRFSL